MLTQAQFDAAWTLLVLLTLAYSLRRLNVAYTRLKEKAKSGEDAEASEGAAKLTAFLCVVNFCALVGYFLFNAKALVAFIFLE